MENKEILRVLQKIHSEKINAIKEATERCSTLNHQIMYFNEMEECFQNQVLEDMYFDMAYYGWVDWLKEIKEFVLQKEEVSSGK